MGWASRNDPRATPQNSTLKWLLPLSLSEAEHQKATVELSVLGHICPSTIQNQIATSSATIGSILCLLDLHWPKMDAHALTLTLEASIGTLGCFPGNSAPHNGTYQQKPQKWQKHGFHFLLLSKFL